MSAAKSTFESDSIAGILHAFVAFDWGEEVDFSTARKLVPAELHSLPRRPRTPPSIAYQVPPIRLALPSVNLQLPEIGEISGTAELTVFDFGAVSLGWHFPVSLSQAALMHLACTLSDSALISQPARKSIEPLFQQLQPAILNPDWMDLSEEYFVFQITSFPTAAQPNCILTDHPEWLAGLLRFESSALSTSEITEALRMHLSYSPQDLIVVDWAAAVIVDRECEELLEILAFANLQLLEFQHIDRRLDDKLKVAYGLIRQLARSSLPIWKTHTRPLRDLGELNVEVNAMLERASSALTLVGDPYLARVYQLISNRFHLEQWGVNLRRSISVLREIYQVVSDQAATYRTEVLEVVVVVLILTEIILAIWKH